MSHLFVLFFSAFSMYHLFVLFFSVFSMSHLRLFYPYDRAKTEVPTEKHLTHLQEKFEPHLEKTGFLHMRKRKHRSAVQ